MAHFETTDLVLARIDERTKNMEGDIAEIKVSINKLNTVVLIGNGKESLVTRVSRLEDESDQRSDSESSAAASQTEVTKTRIIEDRRFWAAVAVAIISALVAIFKQ